LPKRAHGQAHYQASAWVEAHLRRSALLARPAHECGLPSCLIFISFGKTCRLGGRYDIIELD
jgi:hypothetical protein